MEMERSACPPEVTCWDYLDPELTTASRGDSNTQAWSDEILHELREQAGDGCLLCSLDHWNEEDDDA